MPEYDKRLYRGLLRLPAELVKFLGDDVKILSDYKAVVVYNSNANRELVAKSLELLAQWVENEKSGERK